MIRRTPTQRIIGWTALALITGCGGAYQSNVRPAAQPSPAIETVPVVQHAPWSDMRFEHYGVNPTIDTEEAPISSFGVNVDTAAYTLARAYLQQGHLPEPAAVRVEDFINHFNKSSAHQTDAPFTLQHEAFPAPARRGYHVLRISLTAHRLAPAPTHFSWVVDVSEPDRRKEARAARDRLKSMGVTVTEYPSVQAAAQQAHRIILCTDGTIPGNIPDRAITTLGFGLGHYNDARLAQSPGTYHYIDQRSAVDRVYRDLLKPPAAQNIRLEVAFDPATVTRYRLLGYERHTRPAHAPTAGGALTAGQTVTALYELKFRQPPTGPYARLQIRATHPSGQPLPRFQRSLTAVHATRHDASGDARLALVAAGFAEKLRAAYWARTLSYEDLLAQLRTLPAPTQERPAVRELHALIERAATLDARPDRFERALPVATMDFDHIPVIAP
jgi:Ca-activated chloride channel family protein